MKQPNYDNKLERPKRKIKIRGTTRVLVWNGTDWIFDKKKASDKASKEG